jgi:hypothetical protein
VLELGKAGSAGLAKGEAPVLRDGAVVALLRAANWQEAATAVVKDREWRQVDVEYASMWKGTHRFLGNGAQLAESGSTGRWSPRPTLTADNSLPLSHQVFLLWTALVLQRRNINAAMGAATGAAVIGGSS